MATAPLPPNFAVINSAIARLRFVDDKGMLTRDGVMFLVGIFNRVGGSSGPSIPDVETSLAEDSGISETQAVLFTLGDEVKQDRSSAAIEAVTTEIKKDIDSLYQLGDVSALRAEVAELRKMINDLQQGYQL